MLRNGGLNTSPMSAMSDNSTGSASDPKTVSPDFLVIKSDDSGEEDSSAEPYQVMGDSGYTLPVPQKHGSWAHAYDMDPYYSPDVRFPGPSGLEYNMFDTQQTTPRDGSMTATSLPHPPPGSMIMPKLERTETADPVVAAIPTPRSAFPKANRASRPVRGRRVPHHLVERRYRENLNGQIEALRLSLPALRDASAYSGELEDPGVSARMPSKTAIITAAVEHIRELHELEARRYHDGISGRPF